MLVHSSAWDLSGKLSVDARLLATPCIPWCLMFLAHGPTLGHFCPDLAEVHWSGLNYKSESPSFECIKYNRVASLGLHDVIIMIFKHSPRNFRWETSPFPFQNFRSGFDSPRGHRPTQGGQTTLTCLHQWTSAQTETHRILGPSGPENGDLKMVTHFQRQQMVGWFGWLSCFLSWLFFSLL